MRAPARTGRPGPRHAEAGGGVPRAGDAFTAVVLEVFRVNGALLAAGNRLCAGTGLTAARWQVLGAIAGQGQPATVARIARAMGLTRQSVQRIVDGLEREGIAERVADAAYRRARPVRLTGRGAALFAEMHRRQTRWATRAADGIAGPALVATRETLRAIRERLEADERRR